jgi:CysZ protein
MTDDTPSPEASPAVAASHASLLAPLPTAGLQLLITGFTYPFRGIGFMRRAPMLLPLAIMPAVLNFGLAVTGLVLAFVQAPFLVGWLWERPEATDFWSGALVGLWVVVALLLALLVATLWLVAVYALAGLVATPFTDHLTEQVELKVLGVEGEGFRFARFVRDLYWSLAHSLLNTVAWLAVMALLLLLNLVPFLGSAVFALLSPLATAYFLSREMHDGCMTRRRLSWLGKQRLILENAPLMIGFGLGTVVLFWIPGFNLIMLPFAHVGAALLYCRLAHNGRAPMERKG